MTVLDVTAAEEHAEKGLAHWTRLLCVLFFFSGFPALIYQLTWQRALFRIFGVNIESVTIVVTAFMLGLGIGSLAGGWLSKRRLPLLPLLAVIEVMTAAFGLFSLAIFDRVGELAAPLSLTATAAVTLMLVLVPTLLMGATLPILVGHLVRRSPNVGSAVGLLYYVNTLGAGVACFVAIILVFPFLGMQGAVNLAVVLNVAVAVGALAAHAIDQRNPALAAADASARDRAGRKAHSRLHSGPGARLRRRLRLAVVRDLLLPNHVVRDRLERHRFRRDARCAPHRPRRGLAAGGAQLHQFR